MGPNSHDKCPYKKRRHRDIQERSCKKQRQKSEVRGHKPGNVKSHQELEEARKDPLFKPSGVVRSC